MPEKTIRINQKIAYVQYTNPESYSPLSQSSGLLARKGWEVLFLGTAGFSIEMIRFPQRPHIIVKRIPFCPSGWRQKLHYLFFFLWVIFWVLWWRPRWIYASDPLACPITATLCFVPGLKILYHEHDSPEKQQATTSLFARVVLWTRKRVVHFADACVLPNEQRVKLFMDTTGRTKKIFCVWNCPTKKEVVQSRSPARQDNLKIIYQGSINSARLPETVLYAMKQFSGKVRMKVIGYETIGSRGYVRKIQELSQTLGISSSIEWLGTVPLREDMRRSSSDCQVGLSLIPMKTSDINLERMPGASGKPFDYMACGLAVLTSDLPDWNKMYVGRGYGLACNPEDPESIANALRWFLEHPDETRAMGEDGRQKILTDWNYEKQFQPVLELLENRIVSI